VAQSFAEEQNMESDISFDIGTVDDVMEHSVSVENATTNQLIEGSSEDNSLDFDLGDFDAGSSLKSTIEDANVADIANSSSNEFDLKADDMSDTTVVSELPSTDFDMDLSIPSESVESKLEQTNQITSNAMEEISFDLDFAEETPSKVSAQEVEKAVSEITFDLPHIEEPAVAKVEAVAEINGLEANTFDLSAIDLDLADAESELPVEKKSTKKAAKIISTVSDAGDSQDVNIKLDLVAAYIDMDDKEGARELLEEVLKEGGTQQQIRAQQLLDSLA
jgi:pilus assembly protein FimV